MNAAQKLISTSSVFITLIILSGCPSGNWSEEQRKEFESNCSQVDTVANIVVMFSGFGNEEFDSLLVREYHDTILLDSFMIYVWPAQSPQDKQSKLRSATIAHPMCTRNRYHFVVPNMLLYVLADMKMIMWAQYTMGGEDWGCVMGDYTINGVRFKDNANPTFVR